MYKISFVLYLLDYLDTSLGLLPLQKHLHRRQNSLDILHGDILRQALYL